jgi:RecA-family ATPase
MAELLSDFLSRELPKLPHIVGRGILPVNGKLVIGGEPKSRKSYFALNVAIDLARGRPLFNAFYDSDTGENKKPIFPVTRSYKVLYIENEIGHEGLQERLLPMLGGVLDDPMSLYITSRDLSLRMDQEEGKKLLNQQIASVLPDVVIIDPLAKFHHLDENSSQEMGYVLRTGDEWIRDFGCSVVYIHHTGHANPMAPRVGGDRLRGSTAIFGDADSIIIVENTSGKNAPEPTLKLTFELRRGKPMRDHFLKVNLDGNIHWLREDHGGEVPRPVSQESKQPFPFKRRF